MHMLDEGWAKTILQCVACTLADAGTPMCEVAWLFHFNDTQTTGVLSDVNATLAKLHIRSHDPEVKFTWVRRGLESLTCVSAMDMPGVFNSLILALGIYTRGNDGNLNLRLLLALQRILYLFGAVHRNAKMRDHTEQEIDDLATLILLLSGALCFCTIPVTVVRVVWFATLKKSNSPQSPPLRCAEDLKATFPTFLPGHKDDEPGRFYNFHVITHILDQVRWFGSLLLMSANRWEATHASVKRLYRATRRCTRTLERCMARAQSAKDRADWLVANAGAVVAEAGGDAGRDSELDSELDSASDPEPDEDQQGENAGDDEDQGAFARTWTTVSKPTDVAFGDVSALAEFTFDPAIAVEFWR